MANAYRHKRYFRLRNDDSSLATFTDVDNAKTKIGFRSAFDTSSPTTTFALADSDTTLIVTYEFDNQEDQDAFKAAVDTLMEHSDTPWDEDPATSWTEHFKTEWLHQDGSISNTSFPM